MATYVYLEDSTHLVWRVGIDDTGALTTELFAHAPQQLVLLSQPTGIQAFVVGVDPTGVLTTTVTAVPGQAGIALLSPSGIAFWLTVYDTGAPETSIVTDAIYGLGPKIVYPSGGGTTLLIDPAARFIPGFSKKAVRHDEYSTAGVRQSVLERIDNFLHFTVEWLMRGADTEDWRVFADYSLAGGPFDYYPVADLPYYNTYLLDDDQMEAAYKTAGRYTLSPRFRLLIT